MNSDNYNGTELAEIEEGAVDVHDGDSGGFGEFDGAAGATFEAESKKTVSSGTMVILLVVVLAIGALWSMRTLAIAMAGSAGTATAFDAVDSFFEQQDQDEVDADDASSQVISEDIDDVLVEDRTERQVPLIDVQKNPFVMWLEPRAEPVDDQESEVENPVDNTQQRRADQIESWELAAAKLRVVMILGGSEPMANVSNQVVRVGDEIVDEQMCVTLKVTQINDGVVVLAGEDAELDLFFEIPLHLH